jgi:hypothetical protein
MNRVGDALHRTGLRVQPGGGKRTLNRFGNSADIEPVGCVLWFVRFEILEQWTE